MNTLADIEWVLSDMKGYKFDDKTKKALLEAAYIISLLDASLGRNTDTDIEARLLQLNDLSELVANGMLRS